VDEVNRVVPQLIRSGKVTRPSIGVHIASDQLAQQLGQEKGALIMGIVSGSPAEKAGLRATRQDRRGQIVVGDVITAVDDNQLATANDLFTVLDGYKPGNTVTLHILREGKPTEVNITLGSAS
jgi:S1-C subfamily serine protease